MLAEAPIHIALLMPFSGSWDGGKRAAGAAALAVERVNGDKKLLPGRRLEYRWANSGCSAKQGLAAMGELLRGVSRVDAVIGPGCRSDTWRGEGEAKALMGIFWMQLCM